MFPFANGQLGSYRLLRRIGGGGMGEVYLAEDTRIGLTRQVAIKTIRAEIDPYPDQAATQDAERLFRREMQAITKLDHPYILPLYDFGEEQVDDTILTYMVMPFRPEGSLANWLQKRGTTNPLSLEETIHFVGQAAQALQHAHSHDLIHQDVKPANFLIRDRSDEVLPDILLSDFGIVKIATATATASQSIRGTPSYMAPEQWNGQPVPATDQYALAIMAYLLLTRQFPFKGSMEQVMRQHLDKQPPPPGTHNPALPSDLNIVILRALQKEPDNRFASISAFANAFKQASRSIPPASLPVLKPSSAEANASPIFLAEAALLPQSSQANTVSELAPTAYPDPVTPPPLPPTIAALPMGDLAWPASTASEEAANRDVVPSAPLHLLIPPAYTMKSRPQSPVRVVVISVILLLLIISSTIAGVATHQHQVKMDAQATSDAQAADDAQATADVQSTVDAQATANVQATAQVLTDNPCPSYIQGCSSFSLVSFDNLQGKGSFSTGGNTDFGGNCSYTNSALQVYQSKIGNFICSTSQTFSNLVMEVDMTIVSGDCGGIAVRSTSDVSDMYEFFVCSNNTYQLVLYQNHTIASTLTSGSSQAINSSGSNTLAIAAVDSGFTLYINQQQISSASDSTLSSGYLGLSAWDDADSTTVTYSYARIWA